MFFITAMEELPILESNGGDMATFGYYKEFEEADQAVQENRLDMHEYLYKYIIVEQIDQGIHPWVENKWWYKYNHETNEFDPIDNVDSVFTNFALG